MNTKHALIVCPLATQNAEPDHTVCGGSSVLDRSYDLRIAVDGGAQWFRARNIMPDFAVGDFDSADAETRNWLQTLDVPIRRVPQDKEYSDLELALQIGEQQQVQSATILGAVGGRIDHQLCVLGALIRSSVPELSLQDAAQSIRLLRAGQTLDLDARNKTFSVISLQRAVVTITGARWPLNQVTLEPLSSHGLSNEALGEASAETSSKTHSRAPGKVSTTVTVTKGSAFVIAIL